MICSTCRGRGALTINVGSDDWREWPCPDCADAKIDALEERVAHLEAALSRKPPMERLTEIVNEVRQLPRWSFASRAALQIEALGRYLDECWRAARKDGK